MGDFIDLHTHSTASDGTFTPTELVRAAAASGLAAVALTDHDTVDGLNEALAADSRIIVIPGVELSTDHQGVEIHIVGLHIDHHASILAEHLKAFRESRDGRNAKMIRLLAQHGFSITEEEVIARNPDTVVSRPHIARYLLETGQIASIKEAFDTLIGQGCPCFIDRPKVTPYEAIDLIHACGGLAFLAHPCLYPYDSEQLEKFVASLTAHGLDGMEIRYALNIEENDLAHESLAKKYGLLPSGGSDFHGDNKPDIQLGIGRGSLKVPYSYLALHNR